VRGNPQALFGKRPTEKDPAKGTSPAVDFTWREAARKRPGFTQHGHGTSPGGPPYSLHPRYMPLSCDYALRGLSPRSRRPLCVGGHQILGPKNPRTGAQKSTDRAVGAVTPTVYLEFRALTRRIRWAARHRRLPHRWHRIRWLTERGLARTTQSSAVARFG
jgi:hypothetical protein